MSVFPNTIPDELEESAHMKGARTGIVLRGLALSKEALLYCYDYFLWISTEWNF
jgi:ABC-type glycerol-3-phosphate transport system permease component